MEGTVNLSGVNEQGTLAPQGTYKGAIRTVKDGESKNGDPMISIKIIIVEGDYAGNWVWDNILIPDPDSPSAAILSRTKHFLHCIGEEYEGDAVKWNSDNWQDKELQFRLDHEPPNEYHKRTKAVVAEYILDEEVGEMEKVFGDKQEEETPF